MTDELHQPLTCATYTHARRHPMVLGQIGGWTPPFQLTLPQLGVLLVGYFVEFQTWRWWGPHLPRLVALVIAVVIPCALAFAARRARVEGRSLPRTVLGWLMLALVPKSGQVGGRAHRMSRPTAIGQAVYVSREDLR
jgi:MFS superfamily sulfate permease-like transporter